MHPNKNRVIHQKVHSADMDMGPRRLQTNADGIEREASKPSEFNIMLPKQKHTFVILFPWSAF